MKVGKVWGETELLWNQGVEVHRLDIIPNHHCSWHSHAHKANAFIVLSGVLFIERRKSYGLIDRTTLRVGEFTVVPAGEHHRFVTEGEACKAFEVYWPMPLSDDIHREDNGGPNETATEAATTNSGAVSGRGARPS